MFHFKTEQSILYNLACWGSLPDWGFPPLDIPPEIPIDIDLPGLAPIPIALIIWALTVAFGFEYLYKYLRRRPLYLVATNLDIDGVDYKCIYQQDDPLSRILFLLYLFSPIIKRD